MKNLFKIYLLHLIFHMSIIFWNCDSKVEPFSKFSEILPPPDDSSIVFVTIGGGLGWHIAITYDYKKIYNLSLGIFDINAYWAPNKQWLVYNRLIPEMGDNLQLWRMQFDGSSKDGIITSKYYCSAAKISPDGSKIVFTAKDSLWQIMICDINGKNVRQLTEKNMIPSIKDTWFDCPSWSPDGQNILFTFGSREPDSNSSFIFSLGSINLSTKEVTFYTALDSMFPHHAQWSPVREEIAFVGKAYPGEQIYRINIDGSDLRKLTNSFMAFFPDWSSDGERIVYDQLDELGGKRSIWVMDRNGNNKRKLISIEGHDCTQPVW